MESDESKKESLRLEYRLSQEMTLYYGKIVWTIGTIFHPATFAGFAFALSENLQFPLSLFYALFLTGLQTFFILSFYRLRWLSTINYLRCQEIEEILGLKQHKLHREINEGKEVNIAGKQIKKQKVWSAIVINYLISSILIIIIWTWFMYTLSQHLEWFT